MLLCRRGELHETTWSRTADISLELRGPTLEEAWDSLCSQVIFGDPDPEDLVGRLARRKHVERLRAELESIERKRKAERQPRRRNALFDRKRAVEAELSRLEGRA